MARDQIPEKLVDFIENAQDGKVVAQIMQGDADLCNAIIVSWVKAALSQDNNQLNNFINEVSNRRPFPAEYQSLQKKLISRKCQLNAMGSSLSSNIDDLSEPERNAAIRTLKGRSSLVSLPPELSSQGIKLKKVCGRTERSAFNTIINGLGTGVYRLGVGGAGRGHAIGIGIESGGLFSSCRSASFCFIDPNTGFFQFTDRQKFLVALLSYYGSFLRAYPVFTLDHYYVESFFNKERNWRIGGWRF